MVSFARRRQHGNQRLALALTTVGAVAIGASTGAHASTGCDAVNAGALNVSEHSSGTLTASVAGGFAAGDRLTITTVASLFTPGDQIIADINNLMTSTRAAHTDLSDDGTASDSYTIPASEIGNSFEVRATLTKIPLSDASYVTTVTCAPPSSETAPDSDGGDNQDSQNLDGVQKAGSGLAGFTTSDAISSAVAYATSGTSSPGGGAPGSGGPSMLGGPAMAAGAGSSPWSSRMGLGHDDASVIGGATRGGGRFGNGWVDVRGTGWNFDSDGPDGQQIDLVVGADTTIAPGVTVGILAGYHDFDYGFDALDGSLDGRGRSIGAYAAAPLVAGLRVAGGFAHTDLDYDARSGAASGSFDAERWMGFAYLAGTYRVGLLDVEPSVRASVSDEDQDGYRDSLGTAHGSAALTFGEVVSGVRVSHDLVPAADVTLAPFVGIYGDWRFSDESGGLAGATIPEADAEGGSLRLDAGIDYIQASGLALRLDGNVSGLGSGDYTQWSGRAAAKVPF